MRSILRGFCFGVKEKTERFFERKPLIFKGFFVFEGGKFFVLVYGSGRCRIFGVWSASLWERAVACYRNNPI